MSEARAGARPQLPMYISAVSGAVAGLVSGIVVCPLDVVKTRLQVQGSIASALKADQNFSSLSHNVESSNVFHPLKQLQVLNNYNAPHKSDVLHKKPVQIPRANTVLATMRQILVEDGFKGLYSGLVPLCVGYLPSWAIYFYVYKSMQRYMQQESRPTSTIKAPSGWLPAIECAVVAGACSTIATNPIWMIKTRLMAQSKYTPWHYKGMFDATKSIYIHEGLRTFYSGLGSALLGLPHVAIHFPLYEKLKKRWAPQKQWYGILLSSVVSKVVASSITYPHEVVRSRNQIKTDGNRYRGVLRTVRTLWVEEGWRVFYAGLGANVCRAMPSSAVTLLTFELVSSNLAQYFSKKMEFREATRQEVASSTDPLVEVVLDGSTNSD